MEQKPSVARIVHYVAYGTPGGEFPAGICRAAVITETYGVGNMPPSGTALQIDKDGHGTSVGLCVLNPTGQFFNRGVPYDAGTMVCGQCNRPVDDAVHWSNIVTGNHDSVHPQLRYKPGTWHWPARVEAGGC